MSQISLTAPMRSNLLSLQNIARGQDIVQNRLATGLKVSSAIDNPSSYYTAASLSNRAADLTALLDAMSQGVQTIKTASEAIDSATSFLEQAKATANQALETSQPIAARVSTEEELLAAIASGKKGLIVLENDITMSTNRELSLKDGQSLVGLKYIGEASNNAKISFNFDGIPGNGICVGNNTILANLDIDYTTNFRSYGNNKEGNSVIYGQGKTGLVYQNLNIRMNADADTTPHPTHRIFSGIYGGEIEIYGDLNIADVGNPASSSDTVMGINSADLTLSGDARLNIKTISKNGYALQLVNAHLFDNAQINISSGNKYGSYGWAYGKIEMNSANNVVNISSPAASDIFGTEDILMELSMVKGAWLNLTTSGYTATQDIKDLKLKTGDSLLALDNSDVSGLFTQKSENASGNDAAYTEVFNDFENFMQETAQKQEGAAVTNSNSFQYTLILEQFDMLIADSSYKGINLLQGQNLQINFNEDRSAKVEVKGVKADSESLGLVTKEWNSQTDIEKSISELEAAINSLRSFASAFGNYYSIVTTRQDFTENLINVLEEGADKLTLADMNEESANMLALQTSQQLAVNSLSLASQAAQSVLKLF